MKKILLLWFGALFGIFACHKESLTMMPLPKIYNEGEMLATYIDVFHSGDTSKGATYALKNKVNWKARAYGDPYVRNNKTFWSAEFYTYASDLISLREVTGFEGLPDDCEGKTFVPKRPSSTLNVIAYYIRLYADGDLGKDQYSLDTTATDNYVRINRLDRGRKFMVGEYKLTFKIVEPRIDPDNPKKLKFDSGRFWAKFE